MQIQNISKCFSRFVIAFPKRFYESQRREYDRYDVKKRNFDYGSKPNRKYIKYERDYGDEIPSRFQRQNLGQRPNSGFQGNALQRINWDDENLVEINKNLYVESPTTAAKTDQEIDEYRSKNSITISGIDVPKPITSFQDAGFPNELMSCIHGQNYSTLTSIQSQAIPIALSGRDMVGIAQTGSGKTFSFIGPGLVHIRNQPPTDAKGPSVLVLAPTRELSKQIATVADTFGTPLGIRNVCVYGGVGKEPQLSKLRRGAEICIATPGRLIDLLSCGVSLHKCSYLVLDEADRMLDMGFEPQIRQVFSQVRPDRQVLMWSATWPKEIRTLARRFLNNFVQVNIGSLDLSANRDIRQVVEVCEEDQKLGKLLEFFQNNVDFSTEKVLVFAETKMRVSQLSNLLNKNGIHTVDLHGDKSQMQRDVAMDRFRDGKCKVLTATDVAARGLDVSDIKCVVNFDFPQQIESYIHRIGRTGRCGKAGLSFTLFTPNDMRFKRGLIEVLREAGQQVPSELH